MVKMAYQASKSLILEDFIKSDLDIACFISRFQKLAIKSWLLEDLSTPEKFEPYI